MTDQRRLPRQQRAKEKVDRIVAAARRLLVEEGAEALNTNRIAREAGVGIGSVYEYFPHKQAIAQKVLEEAAGEIRARLLASFSQAWSTGDPRSALAALVAELCAAYEQQHTLLLGLAALSSGDDAAARHLPGEDIMLGVFRGWLGPHVEALGIQDLELETFAAFHTVESLAMRFARRGEWPREAYQEVVVECLVRVLRLDRLPGWSSPTP